MDLAPGSDADTVSKLEPVHPVRSRMLAPGDSGNDAEASSEGRHAVPVRGRRIRRQASQYASSVELASEFTTVHGLPVRRRALTQEPVAVDDRVTDSAPAAPLGIVRPVIELLVFLVLLAAVSVRLAAVPSMSAKLPSMSVCVLLTPSALARRRAGGRLLRAAPAQFHDYLGDAHSLPAVRSSDAPC